MKKIVMTCVVLLTLSAFSAWADDNANDSGSEHQEKTTTQTHKGMNGKTTTTRKHKKHHKMKDSEGRETKQDTTTKTETTDAPSNSGADPSNH